MTPLAASFVCPALHAASLASPSLASAELKYGLIKDIPKMPDTPEHFDVDVLRLLKSWFYKLVNLKMDDKEAHLKLKDESVETQDAVWDALWFHMAYAIKNHQSGERVSYVGCRCTCVMVGAVGAGLWVFW